MAWLKKFTLGHLSLKASDHTHHKGDVDLIQAFLQEGRAKYPNGTFGISTLQFAAFEGNTEDVEKLLQAGFSIDHADACNNTALILASRKGHVDVVRILLLGSANPNAEDGEGRTALTWAAREGHDRVIQALRQVKNIDHPDRLQQTPLMHAAFRGHYACLIHLINDGADVNLDDKDGRTALMCASQQGHAAIVNVLYANNANVSAVDKYSCTPLTYAAKEGHLEVVQQLMSFGCDAFRVDSRGWSPIVWAAMEGHLESVQYLLRYSAEQEVSKAVKEAACHGHVEVVLMLMNEKGTVTLIRDVTVYGISIFGWCIILNDLGTLKILLQTEDIGDFVHDDYGENVLIDCAKYNNTDALKMFFDKGYVPNRRNRHWKAAAEVAKKKGHKRISEMLQRIEETEDQGDSKELPIHGNYRKMVEHTHLAAKRGHWKVLKVIFEKGVQADIKDNDGRTLLHHAAAVREGNTMMTLLPLLEEHINHKDKDGRTALHVAVLADNWEVTVLLLEKGAKNSCDHNKATPASILFQKSRGDPAARAILKVMVDFYHKGVLTAMPNLSPSILNDEEGSPLLNKVTFSIESEDDVSDSASRTEGQVTNLPRLQSYLHATKNQQSKKDEGLPAAVPQPTDISTESVEAELHRDQQAYELYQNERFSEEWTDHPTSVNQQQSLEEIKEERDAPPEQQLAPLAEKESVYQPVYEEVLELEEVDKALEQKGYEQPLEQRDFAQEVYHQGSLQTEQQLQEQRETAEAVEDQGGFQTELLQEQRETAEAVVNQGDFQTEQQLQEQRGTAEVVEDQEDFQTEQQLQEQRGTAEVVEDQGDFQNEQLQEQRETAEAVEDKGEFQTEQQLQKQRPLIQASEGQEDLQPEHQFLEQRDYAQAVEDQRDLHTEQQLQEQRPLIQASEGQEDLQPEHQEDLQPEHQLLEQRDSAQAVEDQRDLQLEHQLLEQSREATEDRHQTMEDRARKFETFQAPTTSFRQSTVKNSESEDYEEPEALQASEISPKQPSSPEISPVRKSSSNPSSSDEDSDYHRRSRKLFNSFLYKDYKDVEVTAKKPQTPTELRVRTLLKSMWMDLDGVISKEELAKNLLNNEGLCHDLKPEAIKRCLRSTYGPTREAQYTIKYLERNFRLKTSQVRSRRWAANSLSFFFFLIKFLIPCMLFIYGQFFTALAVWKHLKTHEDSAAAPFLLCLIFIVSILVSTLLYIYQKHDKCLEELGSSYKANGIYKRLVLGKWLTECYSPKFYSYLLFFLLCSFLLPGFAYYHSFAVFNLLWTHSFIENICPGFYTELSVHRHELEHALASISSLVAFGLSLPQLLVCLAAVDSGDSIPGLFKWHLLLTAAHMSTVLVQQECKEKFPAKIGVKGKCLLFASFLLRFFPRVFCIAEFIRAFGANIVLLYILHILSVLLLHYLAVRQYKLSQHFSPHKFFNSTRVLSACFNIFHFAPQKTYEHKKTCYTKAGFVNVIMFEDFFMLFLVCAYGDADSLFMNPNFPCFVILLWFASLLFTVAYYKYGHPWDWNITFGKEIITSGRKK